MMIDTENLISMTEANQNFSQVVKKVDEDGTVVILKNNKPKYIVKRIDDEGLVFGENDLRHFHLRGVGVVADFFNYIKHLLLGIGAAAEGNGAALKVKSILNLIAVGFNEVLGVSLFLVALKRILNLHTAVLFNRLYAPFAIVLTLKNGGRTDG